MSTNLTSNKKNFPIYIYTVRYDNKTIITRNILKKFTPKLHYSILKYYGPYTRVDTSAGTNLPYASSVGLSTSSKHYLTSGMHIQE